MITDPLRSQTSSVATIARRPRPPLLWIWLLWEDQFQWRLEQWSCEINELRLVFTARVKLGKLQTCFKTKLHFQRFLVIMLTVYKTGDNSYSFVLVMLQQVSYSISDVVLHCEPQKTHEIFMDITSLWILRTQSKG